MEKKELQEIIDKIEQIPTLPIISSELQNILYNSEEISISKVGRIIELDPSLATKILKIVNSSFYGMLNKIATIEHAMVILGINEVRNIILAFSIQNFFVKKHKGFKAKRFWEHSVVCSQIAKLLSKHFNVVDDGTFFISGLIHDLGKLVIEQYLPDEFSKIIEHISRNNTTFASAEKEIIGVTHYQIAAKLLQQWHFPKKVTMQVFYHHAPWHDKNFTQGSIILYLSNIFTKTAGFTCFEDEKQIHINTAVSASIYDLINKNVFVVGQK